MRPELGPTTEALLEDLRETPGAKDVLLAPAGQEELRALWNDVLTAIEKSEASGTALERTGRKLLRRLRPETGSHRTTLRLTRLSRRAVTILGDVAVGIDRERGEPRRFTLDLSFYWGWGPYPAFDFDDPLASAKQINLEFDGEQYGGSFATEVFLEPETPDERPQKVTQEFPLNRWIVASLCDHLIQE